MCSDDKNLVITLVNTGQVFLNILNLLYLKVLMQLLNILGMIPTFKMFFKDIKYFKSIIIILRGILLLNYKDSVREAVMHYYTGLLEHDSYCLVQSGLNRKHYVPNALGLTICYHQLCLYSL